MAQKPVVGRLAPSPSGRMHLGNAFSALLAWLSVRAAGGEMLLRIEDLDRSRCRDEWSELIKEDFLWLGLDWDREMPRQSRRTDAYDAAAELLREKGLVYPCWCSRGVLNASSAPHARDGHIIYPGTCRELTDAQRREKTGKPSLRLKVAGRVSFTDGLYGEFCEDLPAECGDFVLRKPDGSYSYQLAVTVDDIAGGVTQVVRGRDILTSTARQIYLIRALGGDVPEYMHVPLLTAPDGAKLSKRERSLDFGALRERMTAPEIVGRLAYLAGLLDRPEKATPRELMPLFSREKLTRQDAVIPEDEF